jgi:hypothetical protein
LCNKFVLRFAQAIFQVTLITIIQHRNFVNIWALGTGHFLMYNCSVPVYNNNNIIPHMLRHIPSGVS